MSITIKRDSGWLGRLSNVTVLLNGEKVATIADHQVLELSIQNENADLQVTQYGFKSNKITVTDNATVEIKPTKGAYILYSLDILHVILITLNMIVTLIALMIYIVSLLVGFPLIISSFFLVEKYDLQIRNINQSMVS